MNNYLYSTIKTTLIGVFLLCLTGQITGCGQRGALYLPADKVDESNNQQTTDNQRQSS